MLLCYLSEAWSGVPFDVAHPAGKSLDSSCQTWAAWPLFKQDRLCKDLTPVSKWPDCSCAELCCATEHVRLSPSRIAAMASGLLLHTNSATGNPCISALLQRTGGLVSALQYGCAGAQLSQYGTGYHAIGILILIDTRGAHPSPAGHTQLRFGEA